MGYLLLRRAWTDAPQILYYRDLCKVQIGVHLSGRMCVWLYPLQSANQVDRIINPELSVLIQWMQHKVIKLHPVSLNKWVCVIVFNCNSACKLTHRTAVHVCTSALMCSGCVCSSICHASLHLWTFVYRFISARAFQYITVTISFSLSNQICLFMACELLLEGKVGDTALVWVQ